MIESGPPPNPIHPCHDLPIFFEGSLDSSRYIDEVIEIFMAEMKKDNENISYIVFQQDGASCHAFIETMSHLKSIFGRTNSVSRNSDLKWPARSPDLNPLDFYLWRRLKDLVSKNRSETIEILKTQITDAIRNISVDELERVYISFVSRLVRCIEAGCGYFE
uniref:Transposable element Tc3 transposase n=1 Tax=Strongyloides papillosus TaxID=174720 RepID=A0A0N5C215_STREA